MCSMSKFETTTPQIPSVDKQREALAGMSAHLRDRLEEMQRLQERNALIMMENKVRAEAALRGGMPAAKAVQPVAVPVQEVVSAVVELPPPSACSVAPSPSVQGAGKTALPPVKDYPPVQFAALASKPKTECPPMKAAAPPPSYGASRSGFVPRPPLAKPEGQKDEIKVTPFMAGATFVIAFLIFFMMIYVLSK